MDQRSTFLQWAVANAETQLVEVLRVNNSEYSAVDESSPLTYHHPMFRVEKIKVTSGELGRRVVKF